MVLTGTAQAVFEELKQLRRGRGVQASDLQNHVGPLLQRLAGAGPDDDDELRRKLLRLLTELTAPLPEDLRTAASAALNIHPEAQDRFLEARISWLAKVLARDPRTARRHIDESLSRMGVVAARRRAAPPPGDEQEHDDWYVESFRAAVLLDGPTPEVFEKRRIVATRPGLSEIVHTTGLPLLTATSAPHRKLDREVIFGGKILLHEQRSASVFRTVVSLQRSLDPHDMHEYCIRTRVPTGQPMSPHFVCFPSRRCDYFSLRVRFDPQRPPRRVWAVTEIHPRTIDDAQPSPDLLALDNLGEVDTEFSHLRRGFGYGIQWEPSGAVETW